MAVADPSTLSQSRASAPEGNEKLAKGTDRPVMTGSEITCASLEAEGVTTVFGYPGGAVIPLYDALPRFDLHHVLVRFEQWAALAADGYARATGQVGVCIATSGPGATNLVTGLANAISIRCRSSPSRAGRAAADRPRRVSRSRYYWNLAASHQAQLPRPNGRGDRADDQGSLLSCPIRSSRTGPRRHPEERLSSKSERFTTQHRLAAAATNRACCRICARSSLPQT